MSDDAAQAKKIDEAAGYDDSEQSELNHDAKVSQGKELKKGGF